jgi:hypothetical protein
MPTEQEIQAARQAKDWFLEDPHDFALRNVLVPWYQNLNIRNNGGLTTFALELYTYGHGLDRNGNEIPVFHIVDGTEYGDAAFDGYWCAYNNNEVKQITVWNDGVALFTDTMDGCTFGVGTPSRDGAVVVTHVNQEQFDLENDHSEMIRQQRVGARTVVGRRGKLLEPPKYRTFRGDTHEYSSTTFGVRKPYKWSFYAQIMSGGYGDFTLRKVRKIA